MLWTSQKENLFKELKARKKARNILFILEYINLWRV